MWEIGSGPVVYYVHRQQEPFKDLSTPFFGNRLPCSPKTGATFDMQPAAGTAAGRSAPAGGGCGGRVLATYGDRETGKISDNGNVLALGGGCADGKRRNKMGMPEKRDDNDVIE